MKRFIGILLFAALAFAAGAQEVKEVTVSAEQDYEDTIEVPCDEKGLTLAVRVSYDEQKNVLSFSMVPNRPVIFMQKDQKYEEIFRGCRKLRPERLSYPVQVAPETQYRLSPTVFKSYPKTRRRHLYSKWIEDVSAGLTVDSSSFAGEGVAVPLVTADSLYRRFYVNGKTSKVSFKVRSVLALDLVSKNPRTMRSKYLISGEKDLNVTFKVTIQRNPCFGMDGVLADLKAKFSKASKDYHRLVQACPDGIAKSEEEEGIFREHKYYLLAQHSPVEITCECEEVNLALESYKSVLDSIKNAPCKVVNDVVNDYLFENRKISSAIIVSEARTLDRLAVGILNAQDEREKEDLIDDGNDLIKSINAQMLERGVSGDDVEKAIKLFRDAENFFNIVSKK